MIKLDNGPLKAIKKTLNQISTIRRKSILEPTSPNYTNTDDDNPLEINVFLNQNSGKEAYKGEIIFNTTEKEKDLAFIKVLIKAYLIIINIFQFNDYKIK